MQILVVAATELEVAPFLKHNPAAEVLITGVGIHATIYKLSKRIHQFDYDLVIQAGIAGTIQTDIPLAAIFAVEEDRFADMGTMENKEFTSLFESKLAGANDFPFTNGRLRNETPLLRQCGLDVCNALTVNLVSDETNFSVAQGKKYNATLESMEGAAFHYVCLQEDVPFLQIRAVSNHLGERNKSKWLLQDAIQALSFQLQRIYSSILETKHENFKGI